MSVNAYLQRVIKNSPSKLTARAAKAIHGVAATADRLAGVSARRTMQNAHMAVRTSSTGPTARSYKFSERVHKLALNEAEKSKSVRAKAALVAGGAAVAAGAKKALQKPEDDVYYGSY